MLKGIIFDFDGVIAESVQIKNDAFAELYISYGNEIVEKVLSHHKANSGVSRFEKIKYYHNTLLNIDLSEKEIMDLAEKFSSIVINKVIRASFVSGALGYIRRNYNRYKLFISSATPTAEMKQILAGKKIINYFTAIYGSPELKTNHITDICVKNKLKTNELIFFGDSKSDFNAATFHGIQFVLRIHEHNQSNFNKFIGPKIQDFVSIDTNALFLNGKEQTTC